MCKQLIYILCLCCFFVFLFCFFAFLLLIIYVGIYQWHIHVHSNNNYNNCTEYYHFLLSVTPNKQKTILNLSKILLFLLLYLLQQLTIYNELQFLHKPSFLCIEFKHNWVPICLAFRYRSHVIKVITLIYTITTVSLISVSSYKWNSCLYSITTDNAWCILDLVAWHISQE